MRAMRDLDYLLNGITKLPVPPRMPSQIEFRLYGEHAPVDGIKDGATVAPKKGG